MPKAWYAGPLHLAAAFALWLIWPFPLTRPVWLAIRIAFFGGLAFAILALALNAGFRVPADLAFRDLDPNDPVCDWWEYGRADLAGEDARGDQIGNDENNLIAAAPEADKALVRQRLRCSIQSHVVPDSKIHRVTIDSDCHTMNIRTDVFSDPDLAKAWKAAGNTTEWGPPKTWQQVLPINKFLKGQKFKGKDVYGFLDQPKPWGGFQFYFTASRASAYAKYPGEKNWMFDENMKPLVNNPAWVRAIQDIVDCLPFEPADQINADPGTTAFQQFLTSTGSLLEWWGDIGTVAKTSDTAMIGDMLSFDILPGSDDVYNFRKGAWERLSTGPNVAPNMTYLGWGIYVMKTVDADSKRHKAAWSAAAHLGGRDLSMWTSAYPSGFQPYRKSHANLDLWALAGYDKKYIGSYMDSQSTSYNHPNNSIEPRIPGIFQYYSIAEDELRESFTVAYASVLPSMPPGAEDMGTTSGSQDGRVGIAVSHACFAKPT